MARQNGGALLRIRIQETVMYFINASSEDRIRFIERYKYLQPYECVALEQCKKYMTTEERKVYKTATKKQTSLEEQGNQK